MRSRHGSTLFGYILCCSTAVLRSPVGVGARRTLHIHEEFSEFKSNCPILSDSMASAALAASGVSNNLSGKS